MALLAAHPAARSVSRRALGVVLLAGCAALLAWQLHNVDFGSLFAHTDARWIAGAVAGFVLSLLAAAHNISAFTPLRLRARDTVRAQLAIGGLRVVAPSAVSTPAIGTRFLVRKGLPTATALTVVAVAQTAQLLMTVAVVGAIAGIASTRLPAPNSIALLITAGVVVLLVLVAFALGRLRVVRVATAKAVASLRTVWQHLRAHPIRAITGLAASAALTLAHVATFVCCVHAVGGDASMLALTAIYLAAASAGSLVPTPGGIGAVEAAMVSGLVAAGLAPQTAAAAALLTRLVTVWIPAVPGLFALRSMRRAGQL